jgi:serine/threonine protein kinase
MIHRDIKAANIMIDKQGKVYICDFGVSKALGDHAFSTQTMSGTPFWMAPEIMNSDAYTTAIDVFSLGITCIELVTGAPPIPTTPTFDRENSNPNIILEKAKAVSKDDIAHCIDQRLFSRDFRDIVNACVDFNPSNRVTAARLIDIIRARFSWNDREPALIGGKYNPRANLSFLVKMLCISLFALVQYRTCRKKNSYCLQYTAHL